MSITALGVVRMGEARLSWRAFRPVFLAGAAALSWLAVSGSAASADVLGDAASAAAPSAGSNPIASVAHGIVGSETAALIFEGLPPSQMPMAASDIISAVPVVEPLVPDETLQAVPVPVAGLAGETTAVILEILPEAPEAAPVLEPVLQPVIALAADPLPPDASTPPALALQAATVPEPTLGASGEEPAVSGAGPVGSAGITADPATTAAAGYVAPGAAVQIDPEASGTTTPSVLFPSNSFLGGNWETDSGFAEEQPQPTRPTPLPAPAPNASGATGVAASGGSYAGVGWLSPFGISFPPPGNVPAQGPVQHVPAPVSFDPGSSPD